MMKNVVLLTAFAALSACMSAQAPVPTTSGTAFKANAATAPVSYNTRAVTVALERSFGLGLRRDDRLVNVAGTTMNMRVVSGNGYRFAVFQQSGTSWGFNAAPDLTAATLQAAASYTGCPVSGRSAKKTYGNGAFPKYSVHLIC